MAKWHGVIGYVDLQETSPGVWTNIVTERNYCGELVRSYGSRWSPQQDSTNDDWTIDNQISIIADPFAYDNFHSMKYVEFLDAKWKIAKIDVQRPRLILTLGGVYNGEQA